MHLTIHGDFNCPYSALASYRLSWVEATTTARATWRSVEHDPDLPRPSRSIEGQLASQIDRELEEVLGLLVPGEVFPLRRPPVQPNTGLVNHRYAGLASQPLGRPHAPRRRIFRALWVNGQDLGDVAVLDRLALPPSDPLHVAEQWQDDYLALPDQTVPSVVVDDGQFHAGKAALEFLANLATGLPR